jgi:hypothetical protein
VFVCFSYSSHFSLAAQRNFQTFQKSIFWSEFCCKFPCNTVWSVSTKVCRRSIE